MKRLKRAKYIAENIQELKDHLHKLLQPSLIDLLQSEKLINQFNLFLSNNEENSTITFDQRKEIYQQLEQLSYLDNLILPGDEFAFDEEYRDDIDE